MTLFHREFRQEQTDFRHSALLAKFVSQIDGFTNFLACSGQITLVHQGFSQARQRHCGFVLLACLPADGQGLSALHLTASDRDE